MSKSLVVFFFPLKIRKSESVKVVSSEATYSFIGELII